MQFHEILNKQKFICFACRECEKKNIQRLKRNVKKREKRLNYL